MRERLYPFDRFLQDIEAYPPQRVPGTAIFMTSNLQGTPPTLLHNLQHNKVLHERVDPADRRDERRPARVEGRRAPRSNRWATASTA